jgi:hypothetical protein
MSSFQDLILGPSVIGHFINTSHPAASDKAQRNPNCQFEGLSETLSNGLVAEKFVVTLLVDISAGSELLID